MGVISATQPQWQPIGKVLYQGQSYEVKHARIEATASGNTTLINAVTGKSLMVLNYAVGPVSAAVVVTIQDAAGSPAILAGPFNCPANGGIAYSNYKTGEPGGAAQDINVNLSGIADVPVEVNYIEVNA